MGLYSQKRPVPFLLGLTRLLPLSPAERTDSALHPFHSPSCRPHTVVLHPHCLLGHREPLKKTFLTDFRERGKGRERNTDVREINTDVREKH